MFEIKCFRTSGTFDSERLKVTALNLWEPSPLFFDRLLPENRPTDRLFPFLKGGFFHIATQSLVGEG